MAGLALVRHGRLTPYEVLSTLPAADLPAPEENAQLGAVLWPSRSPDVPEALRLLAGVPLPVLDELNLPEQFVQRLGDDAAAGGLSEEHHQLAKAIATSKLVDGLSRNGRATVDAVQLHGYFNRRGPQEHKVALVQVRAALGLHDVLGPQVREALYRAIASWLLSREDPAQHGRLLGNCLVAGRDFAYAYLRQAQEELRSAAPEVTGRVVYVWIIAQVDAGLRDVLLEEVLPPVARRRGKRYLDRVGLVFDDNEDAFRWWQGWRSRHEDSSLMGSLRQRLGSRRSPGNG